MPLDDELDALAAYVKQHFGARVVEDAGRRALATLTPLDLSEDALYETDEVIEGADGQFYDVDAFWEAARRELRRLVGPH